MVPDSAAGREEGMSSQQELCARFGAPWVEALPGQKLGIAWAVRDGVWPVHGLRLPPVGDTCGWYIWAGGEMSTDPEFFVPLHVAHVSAWCPEIMKCLGLPPGWRFLVAGEHVDVWLDPGLLAR